MVPFFENGTIGVCPLWDSFCALVAEEAGAIGLKQGFQVLYAGHDALALVGITHKDLIVCIFYNLCGGYHVHTLRYGLLD